MFDPSAIPTGLRALALDAKAFLAAVRFAVPVALWLSLLPAFVSILEWRAARKKHAARQLVGKPGAVAALGPRSRRRWPTAVALFVGWTALVFAVAGPGWGKGDDAGVTVGRDVVVLIDVSRSMWAEDIAGRGANERWQAAVLGAAEVIDAAARRGGHRVALMTFAARPLLLVPLTTDADHLRAKLGEIDARTPPADVRPADDEAASGTRIGAAIAAAVAAHDPRFPGYQDVILFTDADDPAADDEWRTGVSAARQAMIPVHVVGLGNPTQESFVFRNGEAVEGPAAAGASVQVQTRLHEEVARAIATESRGGYLPARTQRPPAGDFFRSRIDPLPSKELSDDLLPQPRDRSAWFFAAALGLFVFAWVKP